MGRYLAIIRDSFREAIASRVLWILVFLITICLSALAPLGTGTLLEANLQGSDFLNLEDFVEKISRDSAREDPSPGKHLWNQLRPEFRDRIDSPKEEKAEENILPPSIEEWSDELNRLILQGSLYDPGSWKDVELDDEGKQWAALPETERTEEQTARLHRLALQAAFDDLIRKPEEKGTTFTYFWWSVGEPSLLTMDEFQQSLSSTIGNLIRFVIGPFTVFVAILVTASIIPNMVETGSIHLLLSKPISRFLLLLTKFVGGCSFVLLNITYLLGGLWLIFGLRFGIWETRLLACIPIILFLFAVYYSVSIWAGLVWRNTVVVVVVSILLWCTCSVVGFAVVGYRAAFIDTHRIQFVVAGGDEMFALTQRWQFQRWDDEIPAWEDSYLPVDNMEYEAVRLSAALYDSEKDRLLVIGEKISYAYGGDVEWVLWSGRKEEGWNRHALGNAPPESIALLREKTGSIIAVAPEGIFRLTDVAPEILPIDEPRTDDTSPESGESDSAELTEEEIETNQGIAWLSVGPDKLFGTIHALSSASLHPSTGQLAISTEGTVTLLQLQDNGQYSLEATEEIWETEQPTLVAVAGNQICMAGEKGRIVLLDINTLEVMTKFSHDEAAPKQLIAAPDGQSIALLWSDQSVWLFDTEKGEPIRSHLEQDDKSWAINFDAEGRLIVVNESQTATSYRLPTMKVEERRRPKAGMIQLIYRFVIKPIYTVFPRPSDLNKTMQCFLARFDETDGPPPGIDEDFDPWRPVWTSLAFMIFMLALSCHYLRRQEF